jgi:outer membrane cobalamin receptor
LGTEDEFLYTAWGSTAMGADALGGVINMGGQSGQVAVITQMVAKCYSGTGGATLVTRQCQAGTVSDTLQTAVQLGAYGNIGFQVDFGNTPDFDGLTSGTIEIEIHWIAK